MKDAYVRVKDKAEHGYYSAENSPEEYATDRTSTFSDSALHEAGHQLDKQGRKAVKETEENISKAKDYFKQKKAEQPIQRAREQAKRAAALPGRRRNRPQGGLFKEKISPSGHERGQSPLSSCAKRHHRSAVFRGVRRAGVESGAGGCRGGKPGGHGTDQAGLAGL